MNWTMVPLLLLMALSITTSLEGQELVSDPTSDPEGFAREWVMAWNSADVNRLLEFYEDQAVYEDVPNVGNGWAEPWRGREEIHEALSEFLSALPDFGLELVSHWSSKKRMVAEWIMTGTHDGDFTALPATGRSIEIRGVSVIEFENGKIISQKDYYDMFLFLSQLGVVPPMGGE